MNTRARRERGGEEWAHREGGLADGGGGGVGGLGGEAGDGLVLVGAGGGDDEAGVVHGALPARLPLPRAAMRCNRKG